MRIIPLHPSLLSTSKELDSDDNRSRFKLFTGGLFMVIVTNPVLSLTSSSTKSLAAVDLHLTRVDVAHAAVL